ncbi:dihydropteroate synthase [Paenisporosarcina cavernae]|uniref:Dihydropteroate synthase n=1 Tax=Paenisporosarcina cavernae TaxID=2320858 RepID=A0A385YVV8_9BACL|nr:dihydropteroate synthase [Paenisporosarcina cavernae]AYC30674.1 dihydropteroate synthase [Paenisporosarcina cavernae]
MEWTSEFTKRTIIMGILNVTPDSFSDGGSYTTTDRAVKRALEMIEEGADIIDIGGESTRPGHTALTSEEEVERVIPMIRAIRSETNIPISIDTYKADVAEAAIQAGATIINDIWGAKREPKIVEVAAAHGAPIILMHNRGETTYHSFWNDVKQDLEDSIQLAVNAGVPKENIWLDPGIGFGKTTSQNIRMMQHLRDLVAMGYPVLLGTSRKSMIGNVLQLPVEERLEGSLATVDYGIMVGCHIVRVHDVKETARSVRMMDVLVGKQTYME